ncbi:MFS transporter [Archangium violaceum]|uniref:MFS transporter n=1 Tax=Archangium violaceum TaxID=83451 RepID=UPI00193B62E8|nr:MFS transporter [Archangium violaceum]QRK10080.1 MFS transporter [Archangium violaceum]
MVGLGESYLAAFVLALGLSDVSSGLISSVPPLVGAALQLVAPWGVRKLGSARRWVGVLFPQRLHARYFGLRSRAAQLSTLAGLLLGGALLSRGEVLGALLPTFGVLFFLAAVSRFTSLWFVLVQGEPRQPPVERSLPLGTLAGRFFLGSSGRFLCALLAFQVAAQVALPYLNPFMLNGLGLSQGEYMLMSSTAFMAKALSLPLLGRLASRVGAWRLLVGCALGLVVLPGLWMLVNGAYGMLPLQLMGGVLLGGYELATQLLMLSTISSEERTQTLTLSTCSTRWPWRAARSSARDCSEPRRTSPATATSSPSPRSPGSPWWVSSSSPWAVRQYRLATGWA